MINKIRYMFLFLSLVGIIHAQDTTLVSFWIEVVPDLFTMKKTEEKIETSVPELNSLIKEGIIIDIHQSFPYSKKPELQRLFTVKCIGSDTTRVKEVLGSSDYLENYYILDQPVSLYEPSDWHYLGGYQWYLPHIEANKAWDITKGSSTVNIAVIDSRFDRFHPDLENKYIVGYDPWSLNDHVWLEPCQCNGDHGTETSSIAIAQSDGGGKNASIGFDTKFYAYTWNDELEKAHHASLVLGVDVISISFFNSCDSNSYASMVLEEIIDNGTIIVASAGNGDQDCNGQDVCPFCALNDPRVIVVSTTGHNDEHTLSTDEGSNTTDSYYPNVDLCAPGIHMMVAVPSKNNEEWPYYGGATGTSAAAPLVAGICALMRSVNPCITPEEVENVLKSTADPITDEYLYPGLVGAGRVNAYHAVLGAIEEGTIHYDNSDLTGTHTYSSGLYLSSANSTVKSGANITFQAGRDITLNSGFGIELGGEFTTGNIPVSCP